MQAKPVWSLDISVQIGAYPPKQEGFGYVGFSDGWAPGIGQRCPNSIPTSSAKLVQGGEDLFEVLGDQFFHVVY